MVAESQDAPPTVEAAWLFPVPGTAAERYVRTLENVGLLPARSLSVRDGAESWRLRPREASSVFEFTPPWVDTYHPGPISEARSGLLPVQLQSSFNTAFPFQRGEGAVWHGRGFTHSLQGGVFGHWGPFSLVLNPIWFRAENQGFSLASNGMDGDGQFRSPLAPRKLDQPQRFGEDPYQAFSLGSSSLRISLSKLTVGVSTTPQQWGPGDVHPLVMGAAAGGIPHAFGGTNAPVGVGVGTIDLRYMAGRTERSDWFGLTGQDRFALLNGFVLTFRPRWISGLELGATRLFHSPWPSDDQSMRDLLVKPFEGVLKAGLQGTDNRVDDQFASVFARWLIVPAGAEVWFEFVRGDHSVDLRWLTVEPEDFGGYAVGLRKTWRSESVLTVFRAESIVSGATHRERGGARLSLSDRAGPLYPQSSPLIGGWTHRGQLLTTSAGPFGNGQSLGVDRYMESGAWSLGLDRSIVRDRTLGPVPDAAGDIDVLYVASGSWSRFLGKWDATAALDWALNLNRYLGSDETNLRFRVTASRRFVRSPR